MKDSNKAMTMSNDRFSFATDIAAKTLVFLEGGVTPNLILSIAVMVLNGWGTPIGILPERYGTSFDPNTGEPVDTRWLCRQVLTRKTDLLHAGILFTGPSKALRDAAAGRSVNAYLAAACSEINALRSTKEMVTRIEVCVNMLLDTAQQADKEALPTAWDLALRIGAREREKHTLIPRASQLTGDARQWFDTPQAPTPAKQIKGVIGKLRHK